jgi:Hemerythrin HHE cation binding domain
MTSRENLFRPIHKGIRLMLYQAGRELQALDFSEVETSNEFASRLKRELSTSVSNCFLCLLRAHSAHEERDIFRALQPFDPDIVKLMMAEHAEIAGRIRAVAKTCDELLAVTSPPRRIEIGDRLNLEANDLFAAYFSHLNNEEASMVPVLWERFTDEQLRAMRAKFYDSIPLPRFEEWVRWTLPALNMNELTVLFTGLKADAKSTRFQDWVRLAHESLTPERWSALKGQVGLGAA